MNNISYINYYVNRSRKKSFKKEETQFQMKKILLQMFFFVLILQVDFWNIMIFVLILISSLRAIFFPFIYFIHLKNNFCLFFMHFQSSRTENRLHIHFYYKMIWTASLFFLSILIFNFEWYALKYHQKILSKSIN